jgi:hypothetical protein
MQWRLPKHVRRVHNLPHLRVFEGPLSRLEGKGEGRRVPKVGPVVPARHPGDVFVTHIGIGDMERLRNVCSTVRFPSCGEKQWSTAKGIRVYMNGGNQRA